MTTTINITDHEYFDDSFYDFPISLQESVKNIIKQEKYVKYRVETKIVPQAGNFLSLLYEVDVTGETVDGEKMTSLFIKKSVTLEKIKLMNVFDAYSRELLIYNELSRIFLKLQEEANVPDKERFRFLKSYDSSDDTVIMENISKKGYKTYDGKQGVSIKFAELSIIALAKFHAFSYILKKKIPKYFDKRVKPIKHIFNLDSDWEGFIHNICSTTAQVVKGEAKQKVSNLAPKVLQTFQKYVIDMVQTNGCLCHGDYKVLNILVKELDGQPSEVVPIDYQLMYYGNPVDDFLFYIFTNTDRDFRRTHFSYLKDLYFDNFSKFLSYFNIDVNSAYSRQEFENDYKERFDLGLFYGLLLAAYNFAHVDEGFDVTKLSLSELTIVPDEMFASRVRGIVEDYIDWGCL